MILPRAFSIQLNFVAREMYSTPKTVDAEDSPIDGAFEELHKHISDVYDILKHETYKTSLETMTKDPGNLTVT